MEDILVDIPPILPDAEEELRNYLICVEKLPMHEYERNQEFWPRKPNPESLFYHENSPLCTTLKIQRDPNTREILDFKEVPLQSAGANAKNSMSLNRAPMAPLEMVRGSVSYIPFWPGGFPETMPDTKGLQDEIPEEELLTIPPGFSRGIIFDSDGCTMKCYTDEVEEMPLKISAESKENVINLQSLIQQEQNSLGIWQPTQKQNDSKNTSNTVKQPDLPEEEEVIPNEPLVLKISETPRTSGLQKGAEWAVVLDSTKPVPDFEKRIPEMAHKFDYTLDTFQKLAILELEKHNHVLVAAHTSAGKTTVAEYAIALSLKHMTRTIYTSPIKALSNQKYRDFKVTFKDVGLITGDYQIDPTASCLIMTTEILRSMLYCGSDVTRDLEYVIFDEVHYINNKERGHVWEQVMIMLPSHVCLILLSATVPNTVEFADWLGRMSQRKVYVISTQTRPVPLQHYLYTGCKENKYLILDNKGFHLDGFAKAESSLVEHEPKPQSENKKQDLKSQKPFHKKIPYRQPQDIFAKKQERKLLNNLIMYLDKNELLPAIMFIFSRAKCDDFAETLTRVDLTTETEKNRIRTFFKKCIATLKEPDRQLPQITKMKDILVRGIGVHHSGILHIIKEVVEMLFQIGLLKILFATETFAVGVNMPAKTVIFDSISKHDGTQKRNLLPDEYIQMAGRAGRRNNDTVGTVMILCKGQVPPSKDIKDMMLGRPDVLRSQFRITYAMVLSLLRVERLTVEGMMSRSFKENYHQKGTSQRKQRLQEVLKELEEVSKEELSSYLQPLVKFYDWADGYLRLRKEIWENFMSNPNITKVLTPGRVVIITHKYHINKPAIILSSVLSTNPATLKVLVLNDEKTETDCEAEDDWYKMLGLSRTQIFIPVETTGHTILTITPIDIFEITGKTIKINAPFVIKDWEQRQQIRFKNDPPGESCAFAVKELLKFTMAVKENPSNLGRLHLVHDLKLNEQGIYESVLHLYAEKAKCLDHLEYTSVPNFEHNFRTVFKRRYAETSLEKEKNKLQFELSYASMPLYSEYEKRIDLLKELKYVDQQNRVEIKGKVACEMSMNELLLTELLVGNILNQLRPAEVAALLSVLVSRAKRKEENEEELLEELPNTLVKAINELKAIYERIGLLESRFGIIEEREFADDLNFQLVPVVYEWASKKPFATIMKLTRVQEGIIVRCIQQLNEIICDVRNAARIVANPELQSKMEETSSVVKRDIVFAASLYTQNINMP